jgi:hypothetical protein
MAAVAETTAEGSNDLRSFLAKRGVDTSEVDDQALKELEEKYIIARDLDADTVLSKIQNLLGLAHKEDSIVAYEGLTYQLPCRDPICHTLRQLIWVVSRKTRNYARLVTATKTGQDN